MRRPLGPILLFVVFCLPLISPAQDKETNTDKPALTIYNQQFTVVRQLLPRDNAA